MPEEQAKRKRNTVLRVLEIAVVQDSYSSLDSNTGNNMGCGALEI